MQIDANSCHLFSFPLLLSSITDPSQKENLGIIVQYKVKVKLCLGPLGGDVVAELPFILMHPKPEDDGDTLLPLVEGEEADANNLNDETGTKDISDINLIQLDT